jgi:hypothetical protein
MDNHQNWLSASMYVHGCVCCELLPHLFVTSRYSSWLSMDASAAEPAAFAAAEPAALQRHKQADTVSLKCLLRHGTQLSRQYHTGCSRSSSPAARKAGRHIVTQLPVEAMPTAELSRQHHTQVQKSRQLCGTATRQTRFWASQAGTNILHSTPPTVRLDACIEMLHTHTISLRNEYTLRRDKIGLCMLQMTLQD